MRAIIGLYVNDARTVLVTVWSDGIATVATREEPEHTWGPPIRLVAEAYRS